MLSARQSLPWNAISFIETGKLSFNVAPSPLSFLYKPEIIIWIASNYLLSVLNVCLFLADVATCRRNWLYSSALVLFEIDSFSIVLICFRWSICSNDEEGNAGGTGDPSRLDPLPQTYQKCHTLIFPPPPPSTWLVSFCLIVEFQCVRASECVCVCVC